MDLYKNSVIALTLSIITLSGAITYQSYMQGRVLGETTNSVGVSAPYPSLYPTSYPTSYPTPVVSVMPPQNNICGDLMMLSRKYCSAIVTPTSTPMPTIMACRLGVISFAVGQACDATTYKSARYICADNVGSEVRSAKGICLTQSQLSAMATNMCNGRSSCNIPTPTYKR